MKKIVDFFMVTIVTSIFVFAVFACDFSPYEGQARIGIDLSILFAEDGYADGARALYLPSSLSSQIESVVITVSGPGINTISTTYTTPPRFFYVYVPAGRERTVGLELHLNPGSEYGVLAFGGETVVSLKPGQYQFVQIQMAPIETKVVIPDNLNNRLVQVNNMNGDGWFDFSTGGPVTVAFDSSGRIFKANGSTALQVIDYLSATTRFVTFGPGDQQRSVAVDTARHYVYHMATYQPLYRTDSQDDTIWTSFNVQDDVGVRTFHCAALAVDDEGFVYILNDSGLELYKYNPDPAIPGADRVIAQYTIPSTPWDVMVKGDYVYIAVNAVNVHSIIRLTKNLTSPQTFGSAATSSGDTTPGHFFGPRRFMAVVNKKFYVIDEGTITGPENGYNVNRIVSFDDIASWAGWEAKRGTEMGGDDFNFYHSC